jgi:hypothetical protein
MKTAASTDPPTTSWTPSKLHVFDPVCQCVYCGNRERKLGKEHVVPFGLGGRIILPKSSCISPDPKNNPACSDITREIEQQCLRPMLGNLRIRLDMPTRNPDERPDFVQVNAGRGGGVNWQHERSLDIPIGDFPRALALPTLAPPRIITKDRDGDWGGDIWTHIVEKDLDDFHVKYDCWPEVARVHPLFFFRMIAKIAHAWTCGVEGAQNFRPLLTDLILGKTEVIRDFIGGEPTTPPAEPGRSHSLRTDYYRIDGADYVGANVRLFNDFGAPEYIVIVGERLSQ